MEINIQIGITEDAKTFIKEILGIKSVSIEQRLGKYVPKKEEEIFPEPEPVIFPEPEPVVEPIKNGKAKKNAAPAPTIEDVRAVMAPLQAAGKRAQLKSILTDLGAENVPSLPQEKYQNFIDKMKEL